MQPLVSIVTPVYNGEKYLRECIESVIAQTYDNWEYIIVNNRSTDATLQIAESYANEDDRIKIYTNDEFLSAMQNWNHSLKLISPESKYCKIIHADDWLFPECIEKMVELVDKYPNVGIVGSYVLANERVVCDGVPYATSVVPGKEVCRNNFVLEDYYLFGTPSSLLIRSEIIRKRDRFYNENNYHTDKEVCFEILLDWDFGFVHQVLSFTRLHPETQTTKVKKLGTIKVHNIYLIKKYGKHFFSDGEYEVVLRNRLRRYYAFLGREIFKLNKNGLWEHQKEVLRKSGERLRYDMLIIFSLRELYIKVLSTFMNPLKKYRGVRSKYFGK